MLVLKKLPEDVLLRFNHNISSIPNMRTKAYSSPLCAKGSSETARARVQKTPSTQPGKKESLI
jgi:hypothetical protein